MHKELVFILGGFCKKRYKLTLGSAKKTQAKREKIQTKEEGIGAKKDKLVFIEVIFGPKRYKLKGACSFKKIQAKKRVGQRGKKRTPSGVPFLQGSEQHLQHL